MPFLLAHALDNRQLILEVFKTWKALSSKKGQTVLYVQSFTEHVQRRKPVKAKVGMSQFA